jgi:hypothetical protein
MGQEGHRGSPAGHAGASEPEAQASCSFVRTAAWTAASVAVTLAVVLLLPLNGTALFQQLNAPRAAASFADRCSQLPGMHDQLCSAYSQAVGEDKWAVASAWQQVSPESCECTALCCCWSATAFLFHLFAAALHSTTCSTAAPVTQMYWLARSAASSASHGCSGPLYVQCSSLH